MSTEKYISADLLPRFVREDSQTLINFLESYYDFVNGKDKPSYIIDRIIAEHDLDKVIDEKYLNRIRYEIANNIPESPFVQKAFLLKRIVDYYGTKGNEESIKYFFRVFFGDEVSVYDPWDDVFIPSSGAWVRDNIINLVLYQGTLNELLSQEIVQLKLSGRELGRAKIKSAKEKVFNNQKYYEIVLREDSIQGTFNTNTDIQTVNGNCKGNLIRSFAEIKIEDKGKNYQLNDIIYLNNKENISFLASVERIGLQGEIEKIKILNYGISSTAQYRDDITQADLKSLSYVLIRGTLNGVQLNDITIDHENISLYDGENIIVEGFYSAGVLTANIIIPFVQDNIILHDFNYQLETDPIDISKDFKSGYDIFIKTNIGSEAEFKLRFDNIIKTSGRYEDSRGRPSNFSVIQDSFYYQVFSYEVSSSRQISDWILPLTQISHPAGSKVFNRIVKDNNINLNLDYGVNGDILFGELEKEINIEESLKIQSTLGIFSDNYFESDYTFPGYAGDTLVNKVLQNQGVTTTQVEIVSSIKPPPPPPPYWELEVTTTTSNQNYAFSVASGSDIDLNVDYEDSPDEFTSVSINSTGLKSHTFTDPGVHRVRISGSGTGLNIRLGGTVGTTPALVTKTGIINAISGITNFSNTFFDCSSLTSIPAGLFDNNVNATDFFQTFRDCSNLSSIPAGLFDNNVNVTNFGGTFSDCSSLTSIPAGLFDNNVNAIFFSSTFRDCSNLESIPAGLFDNNVNVTNFGGTFFNCSNLESIPAGLFDNNVNVTNFSSTFRDCSNLESIPAGLFDNNVNVTSFSSTFSNCSNLETIPAGLFDNNVNVTSFSGTFFNCSNLESIPAGLFDNNVNVTNFSSTFIGCSNLTSIPAGLFDNNVNVTSFGSTFSDCPSLTSIPAGLFDNNVNAIFFSSTFRDCSNLETIPAGLFDNNVNVTNFSSTFDGCSNLTSIPAGLFDNNVNVTSFFQTFFGCSSLTMRNDIFGTDLNSHFNGRTVNFNQFFRLEIPFTGTQGTAPELWTVTTGTINNPTTNGGMFGGHSTASLSNYDDIPSDWK